MSVARPDAHVLHGRALAEIGLAFDSLQSGA
jgi:hypothetical protein